MGNLLHLYFAPSGRISRATWWLNTIILAVVAFASIFAIAIFSALTFAATHVPAFAAIILAVVASWCELALNIKRLHDQTRSAWWLLIYLVPFIGFFVLLGLLGFVASDRGDNRYGPETQVRMYGSPYQEG